MHTALHVLKYVGSVVIFDFFHPQLPEEKRKRKKTCRCIYMNTVPINSRVSPGIVYGYPGACPSITSSNIQDQHPGTLEYPGILNHENVDIYIYTFHVCLLGIDTRRV